MAAELVTTLHGDTLRLVCERSGKHYTGLGQAARALRLPGRLQKRLLRLDIAFAVVRHITCPFAADFVKEIAAALPKDAKFDQKDDAMVAKNPAAFAQVDTNIDHKYVDQDTGEHKVEGHLSQGQGGGDQGIGQDAGEDLASEAKLMEANYKTQNPAAFAQVDTDIDPVIQAMHNNPAAFLQKEHKGVDHHAGDYKKDDARAMAKNPAAFAQVNNDAVTQALGSVLDHQKDANFDQKDDAMAKNPAAFAQVDTNIDHKYVDQDTGEHKVEEHLSQGQGGGDQGIGQDAGGDLAASEAKLMEAIDALERDPKFANYKAKNPAAFAQVDTEYIDAVIQAMANDPAAFAQMDKKKIGAVIQAWVSVQKAASFPSPDLVAKLFQALGSVREALFPCQDQKNVNEAASSQP